MSTAPIDYDTLARQAGAIASTQPPAPAAAPPQNIDYDALARQAGAIASTPSAAHMPQFSPDHYRQADDSRTIVPITMARGQGVPDEEILDYVGKTQPELVQPIAQARTAGRAPADILNEIRDTGKLGAPAPASSSITGALSDYGKGVWSQLNPAVMVEGINQAFYHPIDTAKALLQSQGQVGQEALSSFGKGDYAEGFKHGLLYLIPFLGPQVDAISNKAEQGHLAEALGEATGAGLLLAAPESPVVRSGVAKAAQAIGEADIPGRAGAFIARPSTLDNFSDAFAAVPTQKAVLTNAMDTFQRMGVRPAKNIHDMSAAVENARARLSGVYNTLIPFVENRLIPADSVIDGLEAQKAGYARKGVVSPSNQAFVNKIDEEIETVQSLASQNGNGKLDFNDVRYLRDGMNGRTDFKSPQAEENFYRSVGDVYRQALDQMAPETTGINRDWANLDSAKFVADKNIAMGRGTTASGLEKLLKPKRIANVLGAGFGAMLGGPGGAVTGAVAPDALAATTRFAKSLPERVRAAANYRPPVEYPNPATAPRPEPAGLLEPASVRMPGGPDASGPIPGGPRVGAGISPEVGNRMLPPASRIQTPGFAVSGDDLVPVKDPSTGQWVYVPQWTLQEHAAPIHTQPEGIESTSGSETTPLANSSRGVPQSGDAGDRRRPDLAPIAGAQRGGISDAPESHESVGPHDGGTEGVSGNRVKPQSGAEIEAERILREAKAKAAQKSQVKAQDSAEDEGEAPVGKMMRPFPDVPFDQAHATPDEVLRDSRIIYKPGKGGRKGIVYVNPQAREILAYVGKAADDSNFEGYWMNGPLVRDVVKTIDRAMLKSEFGIRSIKPLFQIRQALKQASKENGSVMIVEAGPGQTLQNVRSSIYHESHHANEADFTPEQAKTFMDDPLAYKAGRTLVGDDPNKPRYADDPVNLTSEIGAHLQQGPSGWEAMDLTPEQAEVLWRRYVRHYPDAFQFDRMRPKLREAANEELGLRKQSGESSEHR